MNYLNEVRIIAGSLRGRKLRFPNIPGLRPTPNRVRETLFNWLMPVIQDTTCLEPFAGSGALGFEAISRGAAKVVMCEQDMAIINYLKQTTEKFKLKNIIVKHATMPQDLKLFSQEKFNIVFLDPPFHSKLIAPMAELLEQHNMLQPDAYIYIEYAKELGLPDLPTNWQNHRTAYAGAVGYALYRNHSTSK